MTSHSTTSKPGDLAREVGERRRERLLLVEAGDLDDELHAGRAGATGRAERSTPYTRWRPVSHMASATLTRPAPGPDPAAGAAAGAGRGPCSRSRRSRSARWSGSSSTRRIPNYDSYYSLLWGRELLHGVMPSFDGYRAPTEHPLAVAFGALLSLVGDGGDRVMVGATLASFVVLAAGLYRLARRVVHAARRPRRRRAAVHALRLPVPRRARATSTSRTWRFVVWAAALEAERPRRGTPVFVLLALRGPDAPRGVAAERPVLAVVRRCPPSWRAARHATPRSPPPAR